MNKALQTLLDEELAHAIEYDAERHAVVGERPPGDSALASHLPMALHALAELGASEAQLRDWFAQARSTMPVALPWPALQASEQQFTREAQQLGIDGVLERRLPVLMRHAGSVAFHALIRTAHAYEAGHRLQVLRALAWWAQRDLLMPQVSDRPALPLADWWSRVQALPAQRGGLISQRMRTASLDPAFAAWAPALQLDAGTPLELARTVAQAYAASGNFTLLHGVTGCRAFMVLWLHLPPAARGEALRAFSVHLAAAQCASGWRGEHRPAPPLRGWPALREAALQPGQDEHVIKLIHAAQWFEARDPDPLWAQVASRALARH